MKPTRVANAYFVITFLSISLGTMFYYCSLSNENRFEFITLVGVEGADWNLLCNDIYLLFCYMFN